ncbi:MAG: LysR substrate-binding domain-containing protein [Thalassobaculales bacterium]
MDTRALRYFQAVAEFGSYSRAAEWLRISQPAVSRQIAKLEAELGTPLFDRRGHGVVPTEAGRLLGERARDLLRRLERAKAEVRGARDGPTGSLSFAVPPAAGAILVPPLVARFGAAFPNVFLRVVGGFSGYIHEWLVRGQVDVALVHDPLPQRGFSADPLVREEVFLVGGPQAEPFGAGRDGEGELRTEHLAGLPLVLPSRSNASRRLLDHWTAGGAVPIDLKVEADDHGVIRGLLRRGLAYSLLTGAAVAEDVAAGRLRAWPFRPAAYWTLALVRPLQPAPFVAEFAAMAAETARALLAAGDWPGEPAAPD